MISDERVEAALEYIRDHARPLAQAAAEVEMLGHKIKTLKAVAFSAASGTVAEREACANQNAGVISAYEALRDAVARREEYRTLIKAAELLIDVWRTEAANMRRGNI